MDMGGTQFTRRIFFMFLLLTLISCRYEKVEKVIQQPNTSVCDTSNVTYKDDIRKILKDHCEGCHTASSPDGGYRLDSYAGVKASVGRLVGVVSHSSGFSPMPKGGNKLDACSIQKIEKWVQDGALDN
jgi:mono/diheme cytochrome c family protein